MKKRNYWPLLFIGIFGFTFAMIIWTIVSAVNTPVHEDKSFLSTYHNIDSDYNKIVESNNIFKTKYNINIKINNASFGLDINDVFASQRVLDKKSKHKDIFQKGKNILIVELSDKNGVEVDALMKFKITRGTNAYSDIDISNEENNKKELTFDLKAVGNWNIMGTIETQDKSKGYFYIKSNAINR